MDLRAQPLRARRREQPLTLSGRIGTGLAECVDETSTLRGSLDTTRARVFDECFTRSVRHRVEREVCRHHVREVLPLTEAFGSVQLAHLGVVLESVPALD